MKDSYHAFHWSLEKIVTEQWAYYHNVFTPEECQKIIDIGTNKVTGATTLKVGEVYAGGETTTEMDSIRKSSISWLFANEDDTRWIFERVTHVISSLNAGFFNYDLDYIENLQFTEYDSSVSSEYYKPHVDALVFSAGARKLSFSVQLSDPDSYEGGDLLFHLGGDPIPGMRDQGTMNLFPSFVLHEVTPVVKGARHSLVGWVVGPKFR